MALIRQHLVRKYAELLEQFGLDFVSEPIEVERKQLVADVISFINGVRMAEKFGSAGILQLLRSSNQLEPFRPDLQSECLKKIELIVVSRLFPWTYEFDEIPTYSAFFSQKLVKCLVGIDDIFKQCGYALSEEKSCWIALNDRSDAKLIDLAFDCMVASLECLAIDELYQLAVASGMSSSAEHIWSIRSTTVGTPESCVSRLLNSSKSSAVRPADLINFAGGDRNLNVTRIDIDYQLPPVVKNSTILRRQMPSYEPTLPIVSNRPYSTIAKPPAYSSVQPSLPPQPTPITSVGDFRLKLQTLKSPLTKVHNSATKELERMRKRKCPRCQMDSHNLVMCEFCDFLYKYTK